ncbi:ribosome biogenesis GTPase Der [Wenzhouxiangella sp. AB-CW3]|uniref:ribosome biogenesis GTPase Der n=1 Tax=Wenzhouxiangella sp. AB-CW3 TaxID=2771012 RepID=UPI00168BF55F|nr:ribosome biogenesis GTPase Der [Wenzhouxiangella sp. AB-CW3]QOC23987.1 ribosome biogenesis GTPase Der [Wenzhouxiangella sp. AB-CW3]
MSSLPVVAIVGRPNVGKSTLFNALTRTRDALVADMPGVTRDRIYGRATVDGRPVILIDTGGLDQASDEVETGAQSQTRQAIAEADLVVFMTDARAGIVPVEHEIAAELREGGKRVIHVINKTDGLNTDMAVAEGAELGMGRSFPIAASHRHGLGQLDREIGELLPQAGASDEQEVDADIHLALIGRPNAGKSTLLNRLLGEQRALATPIPGTTRDPIHAVVERDGTTFHLVDTAGIRRRRGSHEGVERFSTIKALQAVEKARIVCLVCDSTEGITEQDARLAGHVIEAGRGLVLVLNKWDAIDSDKRRAVLSEVAERLDFARFAPVVTLSALHGSGLGELTDAVEHVNEVGMAELSTSALTRVLRRAVEAHPPPSIRRLSPKLRYAHGGGHFPYRVVIHGNRTEHVPDQYRRYLVNSFRKQFDLTGVPVRLVFRESDNPYAGRGNRLTPRQVQKRKRLKKFVRRKQRKR